MICPKCQSDNELGAKFCNECGTKLEIACPECGKTNRPDSKFCNECGLKLTLPSGSSPKLPPQDLSFDEKINKIQRYLPKGLTEKILSQREKIEGERKQVTVMFCDMEGFTRLTERLGPEEAYSIMDKIYEILIHKVHDYEGTVNEMTGDGIVALFGAPIALEDAPQRAIRSAYTIHRGMARFSDKIKKENNISPIKMRIGIHTGPVIVGTLGNDLRVEFKAVGDTVNLASRMEGLAAPGTTLVTEDTFKLTEGLFRYEALGELEVKGKKAAVKSYRVIAPNTRRTRFDVSAERGLTPFIGRERELEILLDCFERAKRGRGQAISIIAEAGVGKSRLSYEFRKAVANENVTFLEGKCLSYSQGVAYYPIIDLYKSNFDISENDSDYQIKEKVREGLKQLDIEEGSALPYLLELLSVKDSGFDQIPLSPEGKKDRTIETMIRIPLKGSDIRPLIMVIEDLHWMDKTSEEVLKYLLERISGARILLIFTYRPEFVHTWGGRSYHSQVNLNRLSNRESLAMVAHLLGSEDMDRDLEELILEKTEGVPFFIEEFVKSLENLKVIERKESKLSLARSVRDVVIPSTIHDVVMARIDSLPESAKEVLQIGSVIGREFGFKLIREVTELPEHELLSYLSSAKDSELLYERGIYPQSTYIFKHALTQDAAYQSLLKTTCKKYHRKIALVLEECFPEIAEMQPELLGHHFKESGLAKQAIPYWQKAGEIAVRRSANMEAINHLIQGLEVLAALPDSNERSQQELMLQTILGPALIATKGYTAPEVLSTYSRSRELCQQLGKTSQLFLVLRGLQLFHMMEGELRTARELGEQLLNIARDRQDRGQLVGAYLVLGQTLWFMGEPVPAREHLEHGIALYDSQHRFEDWPGGNPAVQCLLYEAFALWTLGYPDQALYRSQEALTLAQELSHPYSLALNHGQVAAFHHFRRDHKAALEQAEACVALSTNRGFNLLAAFAKVTGGWALTTQGHAKEGMVQMLKGMVDFSAMGAEIWRPYSFALLAEVYGKAEHIKEGIAAIGDGLAVLHKTGERFWEAELYRLKGELLLTLSKINRAEVETCFQQALEIARSQQAKSLELRAVMSLGRLWQYQGKRTQARQLLSEIYGWFTEGFDTADLKAAKALLEEFS
jgi:class 3 adenylate cyclase/predicted ATPase